MKGKAANPYAGVLEIRCLVKLKLCGLHQLGILESEMASAQQILKDYDIFGLRGVGGELKSTRGTRALAGGILYWLCLRWRTRAACAKLLPSKQKSPSFDELPISRVKPLEIELV